MPCHICHCILRRLVLSSLNPSQSATCADGVLDGRHPHRRDDAMTFFHKSRCSASLESSAIGGRPTNFDTRCKVTIATFPTNLDILLVTPFLRATFHVGSLANERQVSAHVCVPNEMKRTGEETPFNAYGGEHDTLFPAQVSNCEACVLKAPVRDHLPAVTVSLTRRNIYSYTSAPS